MNIRAQHTLSGVLGMAGIALIVIPLLGVLTKWFILLGILFLFLAFKAN